MKKLILGVLSIIVISTLIFSGCGETAPAPSEPTTPAPPPAEEPIVLRFASIYVQNHTHSQADIAWMDYITETTNGRVQFETFWAESLISTSGGPTELAEGISDIAYIQPNLSPSGYKIGTAMNVFFIDVPEYRKAINIMEALRAKFPEIDAEVADNKLIAWPSTPPWQLHSTKAVDKLEDFQGLSLAAPSAAFIAVLGKLGSEGVPIPFPDMFISMQKGIIDGVTLPYSASLDLRFGEVEKYVIALDWGTPPIPNRAMNWDSWNNLPPDIQQIFEASGSYWEDQVAAVFEKGNKDGIAFAEEHDVEFVELSSADRDKIKIAIDKTAQEYAEKLDADGLPGIAIFEEIQRLKAQ